MRDEKREKRLDEIMKLALTSDAEPDPELNRRIIRQWKEHPDMKKQIAKRVYVAAAACAAMLVTVSAGAAVRYLTLDDVIEETWTDKEELAETFAGENAMLIGETQEAGGYRATLLGIAPGKNLMDQGIENLTVGSMYAVVAIENADGTPLPDTSEYSADTPDFFVSPLIQGLTPWKYNAAWFGGGYSQFTNQGVFYRIMDCDNILMFADRELYLCVSDTMFYDKAAYNYEEITGKISRNEDYVGMNVLFDIPVDSSMADPEAAAAYLAQMEEWDSGNGSDDDSTDHVGDLAARAAKITEQINAGDEEALADTIALESQTRTVKKENGRYAYEFDASKDISELPKSSVREEEIGGGGIWYFYEDDISDGRSVMVSYGDYDENLAQFTSLYIMILTENGDGTAEVRSYYKNFAAEGISGYDRAQLARDIKSQILAGDEEKALEGAVLMEEDTRVVPFENDRYYYEIAVSDTRTKGLYFYPEYMENGKGVMTFLKDEEDEALYIAVLTEKGDGTGEVKVYRKDWP